MDRRTFLALTAGGTATLAGCTLPVSRTTQTGDGRGDGSPDGTDSGGTGPSAVGLDTLATGLRAPLDVVFAAGHRYVAEQPGTVRVHDDDGLRDRPLLDLRDAITAGGEKGLLGLALHPSFPDDRRLFVRYSAPPREGTPGSYSHTFVLSSFEVSEDGLTARTDGERTILEIPEPQGNHNAGSIVFGPDGFLYVGVGDGGAGGDRGTGHVDDWYDAVGGGNGQDVTANLLGSVLRIDIDGTADGEAYAVPDDNPLVGREGLDEQYAWGFRNPWRMSFDVPESSSGPGGDQTSSGRGEDLYVADVGQNAYEEVSRVERGGNYGWNVKEGTHCYGSNDCPDRAPVRGGEPLRDPVIEYPHSGGGVSGISVIGGYVYRGSALPGLAGTYLFGDLNAQGRLFAATPTDDGLWPTRVVEVADGDAGKLGRLLSLGRGPDDELYVMGTSGGGTGGLHRIVPA